MGFDDGPDPLPLVLFEPFRGQAEAGRKLPFALNPLVERVVGLHPFRIGTTLSAVQQTGRLRAGFWSDAPHAPTRSRPGASNCPNGPSPSRGKNLWADRLLIWRGPMGGHPGVEPRPLAPPSRPPPRRGSSSSSALQRSSEPRPPPHVSRLAS